MLDPFGLSFASTCRFAQNLVDVQKTEKFKDLRNLKNLTDSWKLLAGFKLIIKCVKVLSTQKSKRF